jgi:2-phosphosulfolactate phosphatase
MTPFDQATYACRCEWSVSGCDALAPADVIIVVDVLSFSTCVDIAVSRGVVVLPHPWKDESASAFAFAHGAELAGPRERGRYSLSPGSFLDAPSGLRCVLPSPNGAELTLRAAARGGIVLSGCLRNARAVASAAQRLGRTVNVCPAGERWPDGSLRPALEDWLGAGAILSQLPRARSPEASAAVAAFDRMRGNLRDTVAGVSSGRELLERGFQEDVELAADVDVSGSVPRFDGTGFVADAEPANRKVER